MRARSARGFTLIEIVFVVGIVGALAVFASAAIWNSIVSYRSGSAVSKIIDDIRFAQQQARVRNGWFGIRFQADPVNRYNVYSTDGTTDTDVVNPANRATTLEVDLIGEYQVSISAVDIDGGDKVEFDPMGTPYVDKEGSALSSAGTVTITSGGTNKVIQIFKNTGRVEVQ
ncbi:MAG TPA: prepilin-type N-terminal cleavage/methylation domain-containing protein [bacterium]|nr:prepilin-type N-terminal cleavage/methylation domain-containing protein [bacterium]